MDNRERDRERVITELFRAIHENNLRAVERLCDRGAPVDCRQSKMTPLLEASLNGFQDIVDFLMQRGANIEAKDKDGYTSLMLASREGRTRVVSLLCRTANVNAYTNKRNTSLIKAVDNDHVGVVELLLRAGADVEWRNQAGESALDIARRNNYRDCIQLLEEASRRSGNNSPAPQPDIPPRDPTLNLILLRLEDIARAIGNLPSGEELRDNLSDAVVALTNHIDRNGER